MDEQAFLRTILAYPSEDTPRLIYADWLTEKGDAKSLEKAEFLRFICDSERLTLAGEGALEREKELKRRAAQFKAGWIAVVGKMRIENCRMRGKRTTLPMADGTNVTFRFVCDKRWDDLQATEGDVRKRHCATCGKYVHFGETPGKVREFAEEGHCVAISPTASRSTGDLEFRAVVTMGILMPPPAEGVKTIGD